ncbi:hypothetical protein GGF46_001661 [Coemansia sp. RSA 552]|nr:hypothetical protein GGF46_001661 [Coemansia sp. RSA 552]
MAYRVLELLPDPALLNPRFDGYKLRLVDSADDGDSQPAAVQCFALASEPVEPPRLATNALLTYDEMHSRVHFNHLFTGPRPGTLLYISRDRQVHMVEVCGRQTPRLSHIFDVPSRDHRVPATAGYLGVYAVGPDALLVFDGVASVYVLRSAGAGSSEQWALAGMFEIGPGAIAAGPPDKEEQHAVYYVLGAALVDGSGPPVVHMHTCHRVSREEDHSAEGGPGSSRQRPVPTFCIQAVQVDLPEFTSSRTAPDSPMLPASTAHTLHSHAIPAYCEYLGHDTFVLGVKGGVDLDDTELVRQPPEAKDIPATGAATSMDSDPYYWTQTPSDVTVCIELPTAVRANQISCELTRTSLTLRFTDSADCTARHTYESIQLCDTIVADESVWTLENGRLLTLYLQKEHGGARWATVFRMDDGVLETLDSNEFAAIRERLEKFTAGEQEPTAPGAPLMQPFVDQDSGGDPEQLEEGADIPVMFSVRDWRTGQAEASSVAGAPGWLCGAFSRPPPGHVQQSPDLPPVCLRFDVDGAVFAFSRESAAHANVCARHAGTFSALSYILAGKREKRFTYIDPEMSVAVLAETHRRVYIYHQVQRPGASTAAQNVVDLGCGPDEGDAEILGLQLVGRALAVLRRDSLCLVHLDGC